MTDREKAVVMAYTGVCMLKEEKMDIFYKYLKELYGRPVYSHEILNLDIKEKAKDDFIAICKAENEQRIGRWERKVNLVQRVYYKCTICGFDFYFMPTNYCPYCGARMEGDKA